MLVPEAGTAHVYADSRHPVGYAAADNDSNRMLRDGVPAGQADPPGIATPTANAPRDTPQDRSPVFPAHCSTTSVIPALPGVASPFACVRLFAAGEAGHPAGRTVRANCVTSGVDWGDSRNQDRLSRVGPGVLSRRREILDAPLGPGPTAPARMPCGAGAAPRSAAPTGPDRLGRSWLGRCRLGRWRLGHARARLDRALSHRTVSRAPSRTPRGGGWARGRGR